MFWGAQQQPEPKVNVRGWLPAELYKCLRFCDEVSQMPRQAPPSAMAALCALAWPAGSRVAWMTKEGQQAKYLPRADFLPI